MDMKLIGKRIKDARTLRNFTLNDIAADIGVAKSTIQRYENGIITKPKLPVLQAIAESLKVNPAWIAGCDAPMICEDSLSNIIEHRLDELNMTVSELAEKSKVSLHWIQNIDTFIPGQMGDYEIGYDWITRVGEVLGLQGNVLRSALAKQEIPAYGGPQVSAQEAFGKAPMNEFNRADILTYYNKLNDFGKETATEHVRLLTLDNKYTEKTVHKFPSLVEMQISEPDRLVKAAHERTDIEVTDEMRDADKKIMEDF